MSNKLYGSIFAGFWTNPEIRSLDDTGKLIAAYLFAGPHTNMLGMLRSPLAMIEEDLRIPKETIEARIGDLAKCSIVTTDPENRWLVVTKFLKHNRLQNPKHAKAAQKTFDLIPDNVPVKDVVAKSLLEYGRHLSEEFAAQLAQRVGVNTVLNTVSNTVSDTVSGRVSDSVFHTVSDTVSGRVSDTVLANGAEAGKVHKNQPDNPRGLPSRPSGAVSSDGANTVSQPGTHVDVKGDVKGDVNVDADVGTASDKFIPSGSSTANQQQENLSNFSLVAQEVDPSVVLIPLDDGSRFHVTQAMIDDYRSAFPKLDIKQELEKCRLWNESKPKQRKTAKGIAAHIFSWLKQAESERESVSARAPASRRAADPRNLNFAEIDYRHGIKKDGTL